MTNAVAAVAVALAVTNRLGRALEGTFVRTTPSAVVLRLKSGNERTIPFAVLKPGEKERILASVGEKRETPLQRLLRERHAREKARLDKMVEGGWMTRKEADRLLDADSLGANADDGPSVTP